MTQQPNNTLTDKEYFKTWLKVEDLGDYTDQLNGFTIEKFGSYANQQKFEEQLVNQLKIKNKLLDVATLNVAYQHAYSLIHPGKQGNVDFGEEPSVPGIVGSIRVERRVVGESGYTDETTKGGGGFYIVALQSKNGKWTILCETCAHLFLNGGKKSIAFKFELAIPYVKNNQIIKEVFISRNVNDATILSLEVFHHRPFLDRLRCTIDITAEVEQEQKEMAKEEQVRTGINVNDAVSHVGIVGQHLKPQIKSVWPLKSICESFVGAEYAPEPADVGSCIKVYGKTASLNSICPDIYVSSSKFSVSYCGDNMYWISGSLEHRESGSPTFDSANRYLGPVSAKGSIGYESGRTTIITRADAKTMSQGVSLLEAASYCDWFAPVMMQVYHLMQIDTLTTYQNILVDWWERRKNQNQSQSKSGNLKDLQHLDSKSQISGTTDYQPRLGH